MLSFSLHLQAEMLDTTANMAEAKATILLDVKSCVCVYVCACTYTHAILWDRTAFQRLTCTC